MNQTISDVGKVKVLGGDALEVMNGMAEGSVPFRIFVSRLQFFLDWELWWV